MQILTDALHRIAYATDASAYREMPMGVAYPKDEEDIRWLLQEAKRRHTHLIPRAGGTSIAGQVVGSGIVVDVSRYMNRILEINAEERWVRVQPGVVRDELNMALKPYGLFFSPETSTSNRCCIGGMLGNNSCGTHSLIYGSTRHHVLSVKALLANGEWLGEDGERNRAIMHQLRTWLEDASIRQLLRDSFPDQTLRRRSCGYALDECLEGDICLPKLIAGSEGTLCFVTEITLSLDPLPPKEVMVVCAHLDDLNKAWETNLIALKHHPAAVELMDDRLLELSRGNIEAQRNRFFVEGDPQALVIVEFRADTRAQLDAIADACCRDLISTAYACTRVYGADVQRVWALRKAGLGILNGMPGDAKPVGVVEDTAVAPERLAGYMHDFQAMMQQQGLNCIYYGHISTGELHLRPVLDLKQENDRTLFRRVAEQTALLVRKHRGSLSGEHGDGRLRGEFIPLMYGQQVYELFRTLKRTWDPDGLLNMGKIVDTPPMDSSLRYEPQQTYAVQLPDTIELMRRIERCNGSGDCRKSSHIGGTMCPAFQVSGDELWTTRARANMLREMLTRHDDALTSDEVQAVLDSCLACKGCKSECPSNVDMARLRSEILYYKYKKTGRPLRAWMVANMAMFERLGSIVPTIYNMLARARWSASVLKRLVHFAAERNIPSLSRYTMRRLVREELRHTTATKPSKGRVYLFADEFTNYQEAELGLTFARLIIALGYEVEVPRHGESGRAAISKGCLDIAMRDARRNVRLLAPLISDETPLVGIEPSCILSFRDEYPVLLRQFGAKEEEVRAAERLGKNSLLYDEWLMREVERGHISASDFHALGGEVDIWLHGHCHQKALVGVEATASALRLIPQSKVHVIPSGCCGMAGSYGYEREHYATSMAIGEMVLFPAVRQAAAQAEQGSAVIVCAPGTSCRQQIWDGTGIRALHPIEVLYQAYA